MNEDYNKQIAEMRSSIEEVLDAFKIGRTGDIKVTPGPTVTLFEFHVQSGVRASKIRNLKDEFCFALHTQNVRVIAPTERGTVGVEVPNRTRQDVPMIEMLYSDEYMNTDMELPLVLGRKVDNSIFMADLARMPHLLVAGATGMGKSVGLNVILSSLINKRKPSELKLVLVDPKQVEMSVYDKLTPYLAHLDGKPLIITDASDAKDTLDAVIRLMESRYTLLKDAGVRNIQDYNRTAAEPLPYYVVVIDEYGDLILSANDREMERAICRIAQKARAVGIHMIISTQRPDAKIVTGNIKANFPTRIAFRTTTGTDSRVVLDRVGAERLTGRGDMIFFDGSPENKRIQCAYVSTDEVVQLCNDVCSEYPDIEPALLPEEPKVEIPVQKPYRHLDKWSRDNIIECHRYEYMPKRWMNWKMLSTDTEGIRLAQELGILGEEGQYCTTGYSPEPAFPVLIRDKEEIIRRLDEWQGI